MAAPTIVMLVSHDTTIQGGGLPWITFFSYALPFEIYGLKREGYELTFFGQESPYKGVFCYWENTKVQRVRGEP